MTKETVGGAQWRWWAGQNEEWLTIGPEVTREDVIATAISDIGEGEGDFVVLEGVMHEIHLSAKCYLDRMFEEWADDGDLFSTDQDAPEPQGSKEDQTAAEEDLQSALDAWVAKWRHTLPTPNMFAATRNMEVIRNTFDPDMAPGGHDNPRDPS